jgi:hypothetical protein
MTPTTEFDVASDQLDRCCVALSRQLKRSPYWAVRNLVCQIDRNRITVQGTVSSFYLKQIAQSVAAQVAGIECIHSEIVVKPEQVASHQDTE